MNFVKFTVTIIIIFTFHGQTVPENVSKFTIIIMVTVTVYFSRSNRNNNIKCVKIYSFLSERVTIIVIITITPNHKDNRNHKI